MSARCDRLSRNGRIGLVLAAVLALAACDENGEFSFAAGGGDTAAADAPAGQTTELVERDVEAPEVFHVTEQGLWDGRPSLGGVWVAHPDVTEPERVIIRNQNTGAFVIGALFRRERENPGPALQVSSDAASALEMLAGAPATLNVTALRREEAAVPETPAATASFDTPGDIAETALDPIAGAAAAIDAAEAAAPVTAPVAPTPQPATPPAAASTLDRPFIQLGIFSVEENAENTARMMRDDDIPARVLQQETQGRSFWRVIAGPAATAADRARMLDRIKARGFADAYFVRN